MTDSTTPAGAGAPPSEHPSEGTRLLDGLRVVELCDAQAGRVSVAFAGKLLADFGADVVKVEPPGGDASRRVAPFAAPANASCGSPSRETSALFLQYNTSKRGVTLAMDTAAGFRLLESLLDTADIFLTDLQSADWPAPLTESLQRREQSHALLVVAVTPYGLDGPDADLPSTPLTMAHRSGGAFNLVNVFGSRFGDPVPLAGHTFEADAGMAAVVATLAALHERPRSGRGQVIDVAEAEAVQSLDRVDSSIRVNGPKMAGAVLGRDGMMTCSDGFTVMVTGQAHQWRKMLDLLGDPAWAFDADGKPRPRSEITAELREATREWVGDRSKAEVYQATQAVGVPTGPVFTPTEVLASAQEAARGFFEPITHPVAGTLRYPGYSAQFGDLAMPRRPAPTLGQHNQEILEPLLEGGSLAQARRAGVL